MRESFQRILFTVGILGLVASAVYRWPHEPGKEERAAVRLADSNTVRVELAKGYATAAWCTRYEFQASAITNVYISERYTGTMQVGTNFYRIGAGGVACLERRRFQGDLNGVERHGWDFQYDVPESYHTWCWSGESGEGKAWPWNLAIVPTLTNE